MNSSLDAQNKPIYYVYRHVRPDKNEPFYIGIGGGNRSNRPYNRNRHWLNVYRLNNREIEVDILVDELTWKEACDLEIWWIAFYGRKDKGKGPLVNLTDGGDGTVGFIQSEDHKRKISNANKGNLSNTGKLTITNGKEEKFIDKLEEVPEGWWKGRAKKHSWSICSRQLVSKQRKGKSLNLSKEERLARSERAKGNKSASGKKWINNGFRSLYIENSVEVPTGWKLGRIRTWINQFEKQKLVINN